MNAVRYRPIRLLRMFVVLMVATLGLAAGVLAGAAPADAQDISCDRVPYNERIIVVCTSSETESFGSSNPGTSSSPSTSGSNDPDDDDDDDSDDPDDPDDDDDPANNDGDGEEAGDGEDRGRRGSRAAGADTGLDPLPISADDADSDDDDAAETTAATTEAESSSQDTSGGQSDDPQDTASSDSATRAGGDADVADGRSTVVAAEPASSNLPLFAGIAALTTAGAVLALAARRK